MNRASISAVLVVLLLSLPAVARDANELCTGGKGSGARSLWQQYTFRVSPSRDRRACTAELVASDGGIIFSRDAYSFHWNAVSGRDVNGDKHPDLVIEAFSGEPRRQWSYWIFSPSPDPLLVGHLTNADPVAFGLGPQGRIVLHTVDGGFNGFDNLYGNLPRADLYFILNGDQFENVTPQFITETTLQALRKRLEMLPTARFRQLTTAHEVPADFAETKEAVLELVLANLNSGRVDEAWKALEEFWPATDIPRIKKAIEEARNNGVLKAVEDWNVNRSAE